MNTVSHLPQTPVRYDAITRLLHWVMALGFIWIFASAIAHNQFKESAFDAFMWPTHKPVGLLLMSLILLRVVWMIATFSKRPPAVSALARIGHLALYALMFAVPAIGLIRQYGSGRAFEAFGMTIMSGFQGPRIEWAVNLGTNFHSVLGRILLFMALGHILATLWHTFAGRKDILNRMR
ncbi:MAG: cytochrome b [Alcaligenaceae bacterium]|nr:cytochrome b [Alcaligenaceae bacterium]